MFREQHYAPTVDCSSPPISDSQGPRHDSGQQKSQRLNSHRRTEYLKSEHWWPETINLRWVEEMAVTCGNAGNCPVLNPYKIADFLASECLQERWVHTKQTLEDCLGRIGLLLSRRVSGLEDFWTEET